MPVEPPSMFFGGGVSNHRPPLLLTLFARQIPKASSHRTMPKEVGECKSPEGRALARCKKCHGLTRGYLYLSVIISGVRCFYSQLYLCYNKKIKFGQSQGFKNIVNVIITTLALVAVHPKFIKAAMVLGVIALYNSPVETQIE